MTLGNSLRLAEGPQYLPYRYCHIRLYLQLSFNRFLLTLSYTGFSGCCGWAGAGGGDRLAPAPMEPVFWGY